MAELSMYFAIGFAVATSLILLFVPLVHNRAVRLTMRRMEAATPLPIARIRADKDQVRAEFAVSTRRLEIGAEEKKTETTTQLAELGRKTHAINQLIIELGQNDATLLALEARDKNLREQLRVTKEELALKSSALREAERALPDAEAEFAKLATELGERSIMVDSQHEELAKLRKQVETLNLGIANYERTARATEERLMHERANAEAVAKELDEARLKLNGLAARSGELEQQLQVQTTEAELSRSRVQALEMRLEDQDPLLASRGSEINKLRGDLEATRKTNSDLHSAIGECSKLQREIATIKRDAEKTRAALRVENALLRERIIDVVAEVASFIMKLESPLLRIETLLAVEASPLSDGTSAVNDQRGESGDAALDSQRLDRGTLADRIRALQSTASRAA